MKYITATYKIKAKDIKKAAHDIAYGQSIGNPDIRTPYDKKLEHLIPKYVINKDIVTMWFSSLLFGKLLSVNHMMSVLMGGQMDIGHIKSCKLIDLDLDDLGDVFMKPSYGIEGIRKMLNVYDRPLIGGIIKPKTGLTIKQLAKICKQMADGGIDFIKEDEILSLYQENCHIDVRVKAVTEAISDHNVIYAPCCTSDDWRAPRTFHRAIHFNIWCGFGHFQLMRKHDPHVPAIFFQKSGDKVITTGPYSIDYSVICKLINYIGCDFAHVGMYGGYLNESKPVLKKRIKSLGNTIPSFSCGSTPKHVKMLVKHFGNDIMISSGGYINGHKKGVEYAVREFRKEANDCI